VSLQSKGTTARPPTPIMGEEPRLISAEPKNPYFRWVTTHDSAVCLICSPLDGKVFVWDDPSILVPSADEKTHPRCRCRLEAVDAET
jgi:SPP1 gp7 family putative phage head morphogenesis protein